MRNKTITPAAPHLLIGQSLPAPTNEEAGGGAWLVVAATVPERLTLVSVLSCEAVCRRLCSHYHLPSLAIMWTDIVINTGMILLLTS